MTGSAIYAPSPVKRRRATRAEMEVRAEFSIGCAQEHGPVTVRGLFYQCEVAGVPGINKTEAGYCRVQRQVLDLRRAGQISYSDIADATRWMGKPRTFYSWEDALSETARTYRRSLWQDANVHMEIWCEKDALAGVIDPVTWAYDVRLMVSRGFTSETFAYSAVEAYKGTDRPLVVYALYDFDRAGRDAASSLKQKLVRFGDEAGVEIEFNLLGLAVDQVSEWGLPTRPHKRATAADRRWPYPFACELDAIPPDDLRALVRSAIEAHLPTAEFERLKRIEAADRKNLRHVLEVLGCPKPTTTAQPTGLGALRSLERSGCRPVAQSAAEL